MAIPKKMYFLVACNAVGQLVVRRRMLPDIPNARQLMVQNVCTNPQLTHAMIVDAANGDYLDIESASWITAQGDPLPTDLADKEFGDLFKPDEGEV